MAESKKQKRLEEFLNANSPLNLKHNEAKEQKHISSKETKKHTAKVFPLECHHQSFIIDPSIPLDRYPIDYEVIKCYRCGSQHVIKKSLTSNRYREPTQVYFCNSCRKKFNVDPSTHFQYPLFVIDQILDFFIFDVSLKSIQKRVIKDTAEKGLEISISIPTILNIIHRVNQLLSVIEFHLYHPNKSQEWQIDDVYQRISSHAQNVEFIDIYGRTIRVRPDQKHIYITNVQERDTRYWSACPVSISRDTEASLLALRIAEQIAKYAPKLLKMDNWTPHIKAVETLMPNSLIEAKSKTEDISIINFIERLNGIMRNGRVRKNKTFITPKMLYSSVNLYRLHYNFLSPHSSLNGLTPAQAAGVTIPFTDWKDLIRYAHFLTHYKTPPRFLSQPFFDESRNMYINQ